VAKIRPHPPNLNSRSADAALTHLLSQAIVFAAATRARGSGPSSYGSFVVVGAIS
jgi:hypothetical protein